MFDSWNASSKRIAEKLSSDPRSELCKHGATFYGVKDVKEVRVGWPRYYGKNSACLGRLISKADGSVDLYLHLDPDADLIGDGKPFASAFYGNETDRDMGKRNISERDFPNAVFEWISCASRHCRKRHGISVDGTEVTTPAMLPSAAETVTKPVPQVDPEEEFREGQRKLRIHHDIERNPKAVRQKKALVLAETGSLKCEACGFDFFETYGEIGNGFAECHHRTPICTLSEESTITLDQLAIVCSNCHRMLHRPPYLTTEQLRDLLFERDTK